MRISLLNTKSLAAYLKRSPGYVSAMKRAGFVFSHGMRTEPQAAVQWLADHPDFRTVKAYPCQRRRCQKELAA